MVYGAASTIVMEQNTAARIRRVIIAGIAYINLLPYRVKATAISELTYGVGWYLRIKCGLTVGWAHGGNSHTNATWPRPQGSRALSLALLI